MNEMTMRFMMQGNAWAEAFVAGVWTVALVIVAVYRPERIANIGQFKLAVVLLAAFLVLPALPSVTDLGFPAGRARPADLEAMIMFSRMFRLLSVLALAASMVVGFFALDYLRPAGREAETRAS
jgi:hypothetical protein